MHHQEDELMQETADTEKNGVLFPLLPDSDFECMGRLARLMAQSRPVTIVGFVPIEAEASLSLGTYKAREMRKRLELLQHKNITVVDAVQVTHTPWTEIKSAVAEQNIQLLMLNYPSDLAGLELTASEILSHPPCDIALARGPFPERLQKVTVPLNGGPHAERALDIGIALTQPSRGKVTSLRLDSEEQETAQSTEAFESVHTILETMPEVEQARAAKTNQAEAIIESSLDTELIILGTVPRPTAATDSLGAIPDFILENSKCGVIAVKTHETGAQSRSGRLAQKVDRWFAQKTFHASEFNQLEQLVAHKQARGLTVSVALPTLNEEETIGDILEQTQALLMDEFPLIDELVVIDSNSTDDTREIAREFGVPVYVHQELLPRYGARKGKGEALWKSLYVTTGDIVLWCDTDIKNFDPRFIYGLMGPLLKYPDVQFVKGFYQRPLKVGDEKKPGGGRVTELTARPLLNMFYPQLGGIIQPLAGEYGGRRELLEQLSFTSGYGVETSLLIDALEKVGLDGLAQVDLIERIHHNQSLESLSKMAFAVTQTIFRRLSQHELGHVEQTMRLLHQQPDELSLLNEDLVESERQPMGTVPEYRDRLLMGERPLTGIKPGNLLKGRLEDPESVFMVPGTGISKS